MVGNWWRLGKFDITSVQIAPLVPEGCLDSIICVSTLQDLTIWYINDSCRFPLERGRFGTCFAPDMPATVPCSAFNTPGILPSQSTSRSYCGDAAKLGVT